MLDKNWTKTCYAYFFSKQNIPAEIPNGACLGAENLSKINYIVNCTCVHDAVPVLLQREVQDLCPIDSVRDGIIGKSRSSERNVQLIVQLKYLLEGTLVSTADIFKR